MHVMTLENVSKSYSDKTLFNDINFSINDTDKIGLIGINGTGKTTLLRIIAGAEYADTGNIINMKKILESAICHKLLSLIQMQQS